jgi:predicted alpha/beta hydrolase family esterase
VVKLARAWRSWFVDLGAVGHLNPASGFGPWPRALPLIDLLDIEKPVSVAMNALC